MNRFSEEVSRDLKKDDYRLQAIRQQRRIEQVLEEYNKEYNLVRINLLKCKQYWTNQQKIAEIEIQLYRLNGLDCTTEKKQLLLQKQELQKLNKELRRKVKIDD